MTHSFTLSIPSLCPPAYWGTAPDRQAGAPSARSALILITAHTCTYVNIYLSLYIIIHVYVSYPIDHTQSCINNKRVHCVYVVKIFFLNYISPTCQSVPHLPIPCTRPWHSSYRRPVLAAPVRTSRGYETLAILCYTRAIQLLRTSGGGGCGGGLRVYVPL